MRIHIGFVLKLFLLSIILFSIIYHRRASPNLVHIKEEQDRDMLDSIPLSSLDRPAEQRLSHDNSGAPPPPSLMASPMKKRRVTISGAPHPLHTDLRVPLDQTNSTPISPVVMGFTIQRDNPSAIEQVRSMIAVKQNQKALIEQRRGSVAGIMSPSTNIGNPPPTPVEERGPSSSKAGKPSARPTRRSPVTGTGSRRLNSTPSQGAAIARPPSPTPVVMALPAPPPTTVHSLPPPPISFARRRAAQLGAKKKPADIVISPRESHTSEQLQPAIQSAPPIPHAGQASFYSGRFPMALPRLPVLMGGGDNVRKVASNVPPTPTRLAMQRPMTSSITSIQPLSAVPNRSPPAASVPIASTLVPPTPAFHHPGFAVDKSAFLAPFEIFYEALHDSKNLKIWLGDQLQRSNALIQTLSQQQDKINETVEALVDKKTSSMQAEITMLRRKVDDLEDAFRSATSGQRHSVDNISVTQLKGKEPLRNGGFGNPSAPESYTFPPVPLAESSRGRTDSTRSPGWGQTRESRGYPHVTDPDTDSPAPFEARRLSVSASRLDPPRSLPLEPSQSRTVVMQSPPQPYRDSPSHTHNLLPPLSGKVTRGNMERERPPISRTSSHTGTRERSASPNPRRVGSRRNSLAMASPDHDDI